MDEKEQPPPNKPLTLTMKLKPFAFYLVPILILALAIFFFGFTNTSLFKTHLLNVKHTFPSNPNFLRSIFSPTQSTRTQSAHCILWMSPFLSGGGYSSEGWSYILALHQHTKRNPTFRIAIEHHGDSESIEFWDGLPGHVRSLAFELHSTECRDNETVVICHSEPGAWNPPLFETLPCPPNARQNYKAVIGRTMFETDRVNREHVERCNRMDYVWVPTDFHVSTFVESGVDPSKVVKIVQPVDVEFFDPEMHEPLDLNPISSLVLGEEMSPKFVFLSVFKWEYRKGWDVLLKSYLTEFSGADDVALFLLTNPYHTDRDFGNKIVEFVGQSGLERPVKGWAPIRVVNGHIAQTDLPRLYKSADAFVLPSRGEGWGRPIVEAMAMALPVIATNWSGPTEYLTNQNSFPLAVEAMSEVADGPFRGHLRAEPSVAGLRALMRRVMSDDGEAKARGKRAREDMIRRFSPEVVAAIVADQIRHVLRD